MMMIQFRQGTGTLGVGFALGRKGEHVYGKVGEFSGLSPSEKPSTTSKLIKITPPKPTESTVKDGVFEEPPRVLAFLNIVTKNRYKTHPRQQCQKCLLAFPSIATGIGVS
jgi:hypothetical protein